MKFGLELVSVVSSDGVQSEREFLDHVVNEPDGVFPRVSGINLQRSDASCVVDGCVLVALQPATTFVFESQKLNINLDVMAWNLFLIPLVGGYGSFTTVLRKPIQAVSLEHIVDPLSGYFDLVIAVQVPSNTVRAKVVGASQM